MQIQNITPVSYLKIKENKINQKAQNSIVSQEPRDVFAYRDFNISFKARTPENFYEQDFNVKNMPVTMKMYLDSDYETRKHMPPEQMMQEVFGYLEFAKDFDDVRKMYPTEPLFEELHPNTKKNRNNLLAEIEMVKDLTSEPLLKDGSDDLGMYILKKIFIEGKTVKEINKDFYEKDLNDSYKGLLKQELDYNVTESYGIKYPKLAFWKSFIATRDEYKKFFITLPKRETVARPNISKPVQHSNSSHSVSIQTEQPKKIVRKYKTPTHKKTQLTNEIKNTKGSLDTIEKKIRKRFTNSDLEAPFVLKYMSPIMTVSADRVHLSEEMKNFAEKSKIKQASDETFFSRFWKANPLVLEDYARTIPDTIELFEDTYEDGGLIPINKSFEVIKDETLDKNVVDYVSPRFVELLDYAKNIDIERQNKYELHDKTQVELNEVFANLPAEDNQVPIAESSKGIMEYTEDEMNEMAKNAIVQDVAPAYEFKDKDGNKVVLTGDLDIAFRDCMMSIFGTAVYYPNQFQKKIMNYYLSQPAIDDKYKLSTIALTQNFTGENLYTFKEMQEIMESIDTPPAFIDMALISPFIIADYLATKYADKIDNEIFNQLGEISFYHSLEKTPIFPDGKSEPILLSSLVMEENEKISNMLTNYLATPLTNKESKNIRNMFINYSLSPDAITIADPDETLIARMLSHSIAENPVFKKDLGIMFEKWLQSCDKNHGRYLARSVLNQSLPYEIINSKLAYLRGTFVKHTIRDNKFSDFVKIIGEKNLVNNINAFSSSMKQYFLENVPSLRKITTYI